MAAYLCHQLILKRVRGSPACIIRSAGVETYVRLSTFAYRKAGIPKVNQQGCAKLHVANPTQLNVSGKDPKSMGILLVAKGLV